MTIIPRVIPTLLLDDEAFVKTTGYRAPRYVGDPVNVINLFNRFEVDEIVLLDIGATPRRKEPAFDLIGQLAAECWVPLAYGGGITTFDQARRILSLGVEKVVLGTAVDRHPELLGEIAMTYGRQAVVASVDVRRDGGHLDVFVEHATRRVSRDAAAYAIRAVELGAGEILLNSIDRDGAMGGYDLDLIRAVTAAVGVPVVACGGAGARGHLPMPVQAAGAAAVAAGSLFVFQGRARGVVVNFPERSELEALFGMSPTA
jgi:cyclase